MCFGSILPIFVVSESVTDTRIVNYKYFRVSCSIVTKHKGVREEMEPQESMDGQFVVLKDPRDTTEKRYRARLHNGNLYTYEWRSPSDGTAKVSGWYLLNTVVRNPQPSALDTTAYYKE